MFITLREKYQEWHEALQSKMNELNDSDLIARYAMVLDSTAAAMNSMGDDAQKRESVDQIGRMLAQSEKNLSDLEKLPQYFLNVVEDNASIMHLVFKEFWTKFDTNTRSKILIKLGSIPTIQRKVDYIDPVSQISIAELVFPTAAQDQNSDNHTIFNFLFSKVRNLDVIDDSGETALSAMVRQNIPSMVKKLLAAGARVEIQKKNLWFELLNNFFSSTTIIDDLDMPGDRSGLWLTKQLSVVSKIGKDFAISMQAQKKVYSKARDDGYSIQADNAVKIIKMLCGHGLDLNAETSIQDNTNSMTVFLASCQLRYDGVLNIWMTEQIISMSQFNVNAQTSRGITPFFIACYNKATVIASKLLDIPGFDVNLTVSEGVGLGQGVAHFAVALSDLSVLDKLYNMGASLTLKDAQGLDPLSLAKQQYNEEIIQYLTSKTNLGVIKGQDVQSGAGLKDPNDDLKPSEQPIEDEVKLFKNLRVLRRDRTSSDEYNTDTESVEGEEDSVFIFDRPNSPLNATTNFRKSEISATAYLDSKRDLSKNVLLTITEELSMSKTTYSDFTENQSIEEASFKLAKKGTMETGGAKELGRGEDRASSPNTTAWTISPPRVERLDNKCKVIELDQKDVKDEEDFVEILTPKEAKSEYKDIGKQQENIKNSGEGAGSSTPHKDLSDKVGFASPSLTTSTLSTIYQEVREQFATTDSKGALLMLEQRLKSALMGHVTWKYHLYNDLAKVQYQLGKFDECIESIGEAASLVDKGNKPPINKVIVHYNYSQYLSATAIRRYDSIENDKVKSQFKEALEHIREALKPFKYDISLSLASKQDCLVQKADVLSYLHKTQKSHSTHKKAFKIDPERYIKEHTNLGKETIFYAIIEKDQEWLDLLVNYHRENKIRINPNILSDTGDSALSIAVKANNGRAVESLLQMGADPFCPTSGGLPLSSALLLDGTSDIAEIMLQSLQEKKLSERDKESYGKLLLADLKTKNSFEARKGAIVELLRKYNIALPSGDEDLAGYDSDDTIDTEDENAPGETLVAIAKDGGWEEKQGDHVNSSTPEASKSNITDWQAVHEDSQPSMLYKEWQSIYDSIGARWVAVQYKIQTSIEEEGITNILLPNFAKELPEGFEEGALNLLKETIIQAKELRERLTHQELGLIMQDAEASLHIFICDVGHFIKYFELEASAAGKVQSAFGVTPVEGKLDVPTEVEVDKDSSCIATSEHCMSPVDTTVEVLGEIQTHSYLP